MRTMILTSSAHMPSSMQFGRGDYINIALVELEADWPEVPRVAHVGTCGAPKMISERAKGIRRILTQRGPCYSGKTERCEAARTIAELGERQS